MKWVCCYALAVGIFHYGITYNMLIKLSLLRAY